MKVEIQGSSGTANERPGCPERLGPSLDPSANPLTTDNEDLLHINITKLVDHDPVINKNLMC